MSAKDVRFGDDARSRRQETNYAVICGYSDLIVIDCDEQELHDASRKDLPLTFEVITGSGGTHCYYFCPELKKTVSIDK